MLSLVLVLLGVSACFAGRYGAGAGLGTGLGYGGYGGGLGAGYNQQASAWQGGFILGQQARTLWGGLGAGYNQQASAWQEDFNDGASGHNQGSGDFDWGDAYWNVQGLINQDGH
ncbi:uncharacterized protein [Dermacentor andersoni]|uniref:uncharacterized protein n=1 Tax=Dermacentor andersoni TaxID=34620 RepID=UPI002155B149|nr:neuropeptide-like protein 29 [Dermacentor andersoni]